ncbi:WhiB family transcriptional regulator [Streptomyces sp. NPDC089424]|uniref:WhiB family transcriptional regulator n=1 Tax=Streptomyces sp. NPDC089424 TaxID=3365917 RepID=UPI00381BEA56
MTGATSSKQKPLSVEAARTAWVEHPHFKYRGCAPDSDNPQRMAGNPDLHVGAHHEPDAWAPETQRERRAREGAAVEVCLSCPVMVLCDAYANSITPEGKLAEERGVWGGRTGLERGRALIRARHALPAAPANRFETPQKRAVLRALAVVWDPFEVAAAAEVELRRWSAAEGRVFDCRMDVRTANWQRSSLVRLLGLPKTASRAQLLEAAAGRGLLDGVRVVADDGSVPAVPPPTKTSAPARPYQLLLPLKVTEAALEPSVRPRRSRRSPSRVPVVRVPTLDDALAPVPVLSFPTARCLEAAA